MIFFEKIDTITITEDNVDLLGLLDYFFEEVRKFIEIGSSVLYKSRSLIRALKKEDALAEFHTYKKLCFNFQESLDFIKQKIIDLGQNRKVERIILVANEVIEKSSKRIVKSKIKLPNINYLEMNDISEVNFDWMLKGLKNAWGKFLQTYGSMRIDISQLNNY